MNEYFRKFAHVVSIAAGKPYSFVIAVFLIAVWLITGPFFHYSDTWQLIINTSTTIVTFLMVFLIQSQQNRDSRAIHLKLDELIRGIEGARNELLDIEDCTDAELETLQDEFKSLHDEIVNKVIELKGKKK